MAQSQEVKECFVNKYKNLLCLKRVYTVSEKNKRGQARTWLSQQNMHYRLVKDTFIELGYPTIEEKCEQLGGFVLDDAVEEPVQKESFRVLENLCKCIFSDFFIIERWPEPKIISNPKAVYHGMATVSKRKKCVINNKGIKIRYEVDNIYLKKEIFRIGGYYDGLSTYVHELCHMFGGDTSELFSRALTNAIETLMENQSKVVDYQKRWEQIYLNNKVNPKNG